MYYTLYFNSGLNEYLKMTGGFMFLTSLDKQTLKKTRIRMLCKLIIIPVQLLFKQLIHSLLKFSIN